MIRKIRVERTTYSWVDAVSVQQQMEAPSRTAAFSFIVSFISHVLYMCCLVYVVLTDVQIDKSFLVSSGILRSVPSFAAVSTRRELLAFLQTAVPNLVQWPTSMAGAGRDVAVLPTVRSANTLVGTMRIVQNRVSPGICNDPAFPRPIRCAPEYSTVEMDKEMNAQPAFIGAVTKVRFPYVMEKFWCPQGMSCSSDSTSRLRSDISYPYSGYVVEYFANDLWVNRTNLTGRLSDIMNDFVDDYTRHLRVTATLYNPQIHLFTELNLHFEIPLTGGVFAWPNFHYLALVDRTEQELYISSEVYLWLYVAFTTLHNVYRIVTGFRARAGCLRCEAAGKPNLVTRCPRCEKPFATQLTVKEDCSWCGFGFDVVPHTCWKRQAYDVWVIATFASNVLFLIARLITTACRSLAEQSLLESTSFTIAGALKPTSSGPDAQSFLFGPVASAAAVATDFLAVAILIGAIRTYRYTYPFAWSAVFLRTFTRGFVLLSSFFLSFAVVFFGFAAAFHLLQCEWVDLFSELPTSLRATFLALIMVLDWPTMTGNRVPGWVFMVVYTTYLFTCSLVLLNVLISVITYEYKAARTQNSEHWELRSLKLLLAPLLNRFEKHYRKKDSTETQASVPATRPASGAKAETGSNQSSAPPEANPQQEEDDGDPNVAAQLAEVLERENMTAALVGDTWRNMRGMAAVVESSNAATLKEQLEQIRETLRKAQLLAQSCAGPGPSRARGASWTDLGYDQDMPLYHGKNNVDDV